MTNMLFIVTVATRVLGTGEFRFCLVFKAGERVVLNALSVVILSTCLLRTFGEITNFSTNKTRMKSTGAFIALEVLWNETETNTVGVELI